MKDTPTTIRLYGTAIDSIVDGPGLRYAVFTQGCSHRCKGCHNPDSWSLEGGYDASIEELAEEIRSNKLISGVTLSGGDPLLQSEACIELARRLKDTGYDLWIYSGFLYEDIMSGAQGEAAVELLSLCDVLVDGPFVEDLHDYELKWRGSTNQRLIDLRKSREAGVPIFWESDEITTQMPPAW